MTASPPAVEDLLRDLAPQVLGALARQSGDFDAAEDAVQEALIAAADHWPGEGVPDNPRAWLLRTAARRLIDQHRSDEARANREVQTAVDQATPAAPANETDDTLTVLFLCCHPSLTPASAIALTLRAVGGLTTRQIAHAFLVPEPTMAQRISRAKATIKASGAGFSMPGPDAYPATLRNVLHVVYLMFNEGYVSSDGDDLGRPDLADEAIRIGRLVHAELPDDSEASGLLALMLLLDARRPGRTTSGGEPIPLAEQDRSRWDRAKIAEGIALLDGAIGRGRIGEYQLQAAIAALHDRAPTAGDTDWPQIAALYELLERMTGSPVVRLNRAVAVAMDGDPADGLALIEGLDGSVAGHRLDAVRAHLLELAGDTEAAIRHYRAAARLATNLAEQRHLSMRAARLRAQA
ncbi:MAG TPA: sigma-70 family RNA polymerase sigma factor [Candidatus Limnocylindrales bacterium]|nr:sigma-70 family RNA polymerase sigma factor [Candidatus Limnocylindrales bacterium]